MSESPPSTEQIERYRAYLMVLAEGRIPGALQGRLEASDVVQDTLLDAHKNWTQYRGSTPEELGGWLREILTCNLVDAIRAQYRAKRDARREHALRTAIEESAMGLSRILASDDDSPSEVLHRRERVATVAEAMLKLPADQRHAILLRYCESKSLSEMGTLMQRSQVAVAGLLKRGLASLRQRLAEGEKR